MKLTTKTPTPETDDLARGNHVVPTEWAEQLERERDEARDTVEKSIDQGLRLMDSNRMLKRERDEARAQRDSLQALSQSLAETCVKLKAERDEAREALREAIQFRDKTLNGYDLDAWLKAAGLKP